MHGDTGSGAQNPRCCIACSGHDDVDDDDEDDIFKEFAVGDLDDDSQDGAGHEDTTGSDQPQPANGSFMPGTSGYWSSSMLSQAKTKAPQHVHVVSSRAREL